MARQSIVDRTTVNKRSRLTSSVQLFSRDPLQRFPVPNTAQKLITWLVNYWFICLDFLCRKERRRARQIPLEAHAAQKESRIQHEPREEHQAQDLLGVLGNLHATMDSSIAPQVYNNQFCPFTRLPEELLLQIIGFFGDNVVTLYCLRMTSRTFLRLIVQKSVYLGAERDLQFRLLLQRDGRCDKCKRWNDANMDFKRDRCKFQQLDTAVDYGKFTVTNATLAMMLVNSPTPASSHPGCH